MTGRGSTVDDDEEPSLRSIWDAADDEDALDPLRLIDPDVSPVDPIPRSAGSGPEAWLDAEAALARPLAEAVEAFARLDERLRAWDAAHARAAVERLALGQAAALLWAEGAPVEVERLSLWGASRIGRSSEEDAGLARAAWAARRLARGRWTLASAGALARFEGRTPRCEGEGDSGGCDDFSASWGAFARVRGGAWIAAAESWAAEVRGLRAAHRFTQGCVAERAWRLSGLSDATAVVEPAVAAMKIAARAGRGGAPFAPLARRRTPGGERPVERLRGFYADLATGCAEALVALERLQSWRLRADDAVADLTGRTPRLLVALLGQRVAVSAQDASEAGGVSVSAAQRNLALLAERGVAREISRQGRFRMWAASP
ncbi:hypothetical protein [Rubrimonas cliftonensis]|uniref:HTH DNA binding domain-containing protein n=1 Tax=Rubrimonas cliftonensis TaxID=89524 RepID=A0A1H4FTI0_9RHOB|nr:hypothetical protein [Rubrimonas cliftonensis]SEB00653.1 hypothetical protein SAMN05444370_12823 [Rubrimonas cliftonensis]